MMALSRRSVEDLAGTILLDRYRLVELQGQGGAAVVYRAQHSIMRKPVAVKVLRPEHSARQDYIQRFIAEARAVAKLRHDHVVDILDIDRTEDGYVFAVMEYLEGEELGDTLEREGPMPLGRARDIVIQVAEALAAAHAIGIVHRDVNPQNIFRITHRSNPDFVKLLDFGIAKTIADQAGITNTGMVMGTAEYMAPEQCRAQPVDARADIYALGVTLFELLSGRCPFEGDGFLDVLMKHVNDRPPRLPVLVPSLPPAVDQLMEQALAKKLDDRFATMDEFVKALEAIDTGTQRMEALTDPTPVPRARHYTSGPHQAVNPTKTKTGTLVVVGLAGATLCAVVLFGLYFLTRDGPTPATAIAAESSRTESVDKAALNPASVEVVEPVAPVDEPPLEEAVVDVEPPVTPVAENQEPDRAQPEPQSEPAPQPVEPAPKPVQPKPAPTGPTSAEKNKLKRSIQRACVGDSFQQRTVTIRAWFERTNRDGRAAVPSVKARVK